MKAIFFHLLFIFLNTLFVVYGQQEIQEVGPELANERRDMTPKQFNYFSFTQNDIPVITDELRSLTPEEFHSHPEFGILPYNSPCTNCYELLQERKDSSRLFVERGTNGTHFYSQAIYGLFHYEDNGWQVTYDPRLRRVKEHVYRGDRQDTPTILDVEGQYSAFEIDGKLFKFNNRLRLLLVKNDGTEQNLGKANWQDHTVGDEGIYIKNAWYGIDISISYDLDRIKLNYIIPAPLDYLDGVKELRFIDHLDMPSGWAIVPEEPEYITEHGYAGKYLINNTDGQEVFNIDHAFGYDQSGIKENGAGFFYNLDSDNTLSISVPQNWLVGSTKVYPLIIDPLVQNTATYTAGSMSFKYNGNFCLFGSGSCNYNLSVPRPANSTITQARFAAFYQSSACGNGGDCHRSQAGFQISTPCGTDGFWSCYNSHSIGGCYVDLTGTVGILSNYMISCLTPVCNGNVTFTIKNSRCSCNINGNCSGTNCQRMDNNTWTVVIQGHTLEFTNISVGGGGATMCIGQSRTLGNNVQYGVPGYTYLWSPGGQTTPTITVSPTTTTTYSLTVKDACNQTRTINRIITVVDPKLTLTVSKKTLCSGESSTITVGGGSNYTWSGGGLSGGGTSKTVSPTQTTTYTVSGNVSGCTVDTSVTINVHNVQNTTQNISVCQNQLPYTWNGQSLTSAGTYTYTTVDQNGCDSTVNLNLTVNSLQTTTQDISICQNQLPYTWNGQSLTSAGTYTYTTSDQNGCDSIVNLNLTVNNLQTTSQNISICQNQLPYTWNGQNLSSAGTYTHTTADQNGCDSTVNLNLTVNNLQTTTQDISICQNQLPYAWNGQSLTSAGTYTYTTTDQNGCDSTVNLNLTVNSLQTTSQNVSVCQNQLPYDWNGQSLTSAGTYTYTTTDQNGCDSTVNLNLTVNSLQTTSQNISVCQNQLPYTWNGQSLTSAGTYTYTTADQNGCDSTVNLNLTVNNLQTTSQNISVCQNQLPYTWNGQSLTSAGTYTYTTTGQNGCDSTVNLNLIVNSLQTTTQNISVCQNQLPYTWNGQSLTSAGTYTYTTVDQNGCDSTVNLNLTILPSFNTTVDSIVYTNDFPILWMGNTITSAGVYSHTVVSTASNGCDSTILFLLHIHNDSTPNPIPPPVDDLEIHSDFIFIPNAFTPDGGKFNELFMPVITTESEINSYHFEVYDRWGERIFMTEDIHTGWDGTHKNKPVPNGTYSWKLILVTKNNTETKQMVGHVTLLR